MVPRYQRVLFATFTVATLIMAAELLHLRRASADRLQAGMADAPLVAPTQSPMGTVKLMLASDVDDGLRTVVRQMAVPEQANARARYVLQALFREYAGKLSSHPLPEGTAVEDVFLLPIDNASLAVTAPAAPSQNGDTQPAAMVAVVNLNRAFCAQHPSGLATDMLTVRSLVGTLHANLPQVVAVRLLIDGRPALTLAGHADLKHLYSGAEEHDIEIENEIEKGQP